MVTPFQYSCLGNLMDRGVWLAKVRGVAEESDLMTLNQHFCVIKIKKGKLQLVC